MKRMTVLPAALLLACLGVAVEALQLTRPDDLVGAQRATGILVGQVVDAKSTGVAGAIVTLSGGFVQVALRSIASELPGGPRRVLTDHNGRFVFFDLAAGTYSLEATKPGYLPGAYGRRRHGGAAQSIRLDTGERQTALRIQMWEYASISGTIVDEIGEPSVGIQVMALPRVYAGGHSRWGTALGVSLQDTTNDLGEYRIDGMPPGDYLVVVPASRTTIPAGLAVAQTQARLENTTAEFTQRLRDAGIPAAISAAQPGLHVGDWVSRLRAGSATPVASEEGLSRVYSTTFYPGTVSATDAQAITLSSGDDRSGIDVPLSLVPATTIAGILSGPDGPVPMATVRLVPDYIDALSVEQNFEVITTVADASGRFAFLGVPSGRYLVRAMKAPIGRPTPSGAPTPSAEPTLWAETAITVSGSPISDLMVPLNRGFRVSGRLEFDGTLPKPPPEMFERFSILLDPISGQGSPMPAAFRGSIDRTGRISTNEVPPGRYFILFLAFADDRQKMEGWETKGATLHGRDVSTLPLDLREDISDLVMTITDRPSELTGVVRSAQGQVDPGATVLWFTTDKSHWTNNGISSRKLRSMRANEDGTFKVRGIPAGEYYLAALPDEEAANWQNPALLEAISRRASRVNIADGEKRTQNITTITTR
jgi:hypothetical protein